VLANAGGTCVTVLGDMANLAGAQPDFQYQAGGTVSAKANVSVVCRDAGEGVERGNNSVMALRV
jgi:hypothetical protein